LEHPAGIDVAAHSFSAGTLFGGLTGLPLGVFVTGSTMIAELARLGVPSDVAVVSTLVHRAGTAWFAVAVGVLALFAFRRRLSALLRVSNESHFDELAPEYQGEIPEHVRARLLDKKIGYIVSALAARGVRPGARGLDLGCGQGWYLAEFVRRGYSMDGADYSAGQIEQAGRYLRGAGLNAGALVRADAQALPFEDASYDFVYSINAFHHMLAPGAQQRAFREAVRVLRPGGVFVLHEMNTENPVFRLYMGYVFPLLKRIDEGNEEWLLPSALPEVHGASWSRDVQYFTFLPDFVPPFVQRALAGLERWLERSPLRRFSAHYQACLEKRVEPS
ncbi:MAG TPA: class I SAM-dependent methyltransferase, partial [Polyangiaceae bacterium]